MVDYAVLGGAAIAAVILALLFDFYNGLHDAANSIATVVATRALPVWAALLLAGAFNFLGAFAGTAVAATIGRGIIDPAFVSTHVVMAALLGAISWSVLTIVLGIPISSSQSLIGGLIGAAAASGGAKAVLLPSWGAMGPTLLVLGAGGMLGAGVGLLVAAARRRRPVTSALLGAWVGSAAWLVYCIALRDLDIPRLGATVLFIAYSPFLGFCLAFSFFCAIAVLMRNVEPTRVRGLFRVLQIGSSSFYSFGHGTNDAQKTMGVITALLVANGALATFEVPFEVIVASGLAISLGTLIGGHKIVRTMGTRLTHLDTSQGFAAETSSALGLAFLAQHGVPVSTTHSITGAILGVGAFRRLTAISWGMARRIVIAWVITIPLAAVVAALCYWALAGVF